MIGRWLLIVAAVVIVGLFLADMSAVLQDRLEMIFWWMKP